MKGEWTGYDIRKCIHPRYEDRKMFLTSYVTAKNIKTAKYAAMVKVHLLQKDWYKNTSNNLDNDDEEELISNVFMTYQKTYFDDHEIKSLIRQAQDELPETLRKRFRLNIYYKYQPSVKAYTRLS